MRGEASSSPRITASKGRPPHLFSGATRPGPGTVSLLRAIARQRYDDSLPSWSYRGLRVTPDAASLLGAAPPREEDPMSTSTLLLIVVLVLLLGGGWGWSRRGR